MCTYIYIYISLFPELNFSRFEPLPFKNNSASKTKSSWTELSSHSEDQACASAQHLHSQQTANSWF